MVARHGQASRAPHRRGGCLAWRLVRGGGIRLRRLAVRPYAVSHRHRRTGWAAGAGWTAAAVLRRHDVSHQAGADLPFTYPPLAAILFARSRCCRCPRRASVTITVLTLVLLVVSTWIVLTRLDVCAGPG